jgi:molecular chaperone GrpE
MNEDKSNQNKKQDDRTGDEKPEKTAEEKLAECQKQAEEYLNGWKRERADFENYKKDEAKRLEEFAKFANESLVLELISLTDEADIALKLMPEDVKTNHPNWVKGIEEIRRKFDEFLKANGVLRIKTAGEKFNPSLHEAAETVPAEKEADRVVEEIRAGYTLHGKVIRPAKVKIGGEIKNKSEEQTTGGE